ncbi:MAG TPA: PBSX family phage terminase large subunit [Bacillota bacterium]|nr:PBSX family phage terminase large subunit [Bacillota bacterium]
MTTWGNFSPKALEAMRESDARLNFFEGAVRSGKTVCSVIRFLEFTQSAIPGNMAIIGKTERTASRNILDIIQDIIGNNFRYNRGLGEAYIFNRKIYVIGANDERASEKLRGLTLCGCLGDEVTLWPESFFQMLLSRLSVPGAKGFFTTNPDSPYHWLKTNYLDNDQLDLKSFHFELTDNYNLDPEYVANLKKEYKGLYHARFIQGLWVMASGIIYDQFNPDTMVVNTIPKIVQYWAGIDYGTSNATTFLLTGLGEDDRIYIIAEYYHSGKESEASPISSQKSPAQYSIEYRNWIRNLNITPRKVFIDPSAAGFITQLWSDGVTGIEKADNDVLDGIGLISSLIGNDLLRVHRSCANTLHELSVYSWDAKAQRIGIDKPLKINDHCLDNLRYQVMGNQNLWLSKLRKTS